jgi:transcription factor IIIB subunit 2
MSNTGGLYSGGYGSGNSRENTLAKARIKIKAVADSVGNLVSTDIDVVGMAHQYYKLALGKNFLSGRKSEHVAVACLYLVCRKNKTDHLLIDFSDSTQSNVYNLGRVFVQLIQVLQEYKLPIIDPSLFIHRYVKKLELEERMVKPVTMTALRIVTRMKKDWIVTGRRPDGICAAALLIATRAHGVHRSQLDIAKMFRVTGDTLKRRLYEFQLTPAATLSLDDFTTLSDRAFEDATEALEAMDPPAFRRAQQRSEIDKDDMSIAESEDKRIQSQTVRKRAFIDLYEEIDKELNVEEDGPRSRRYKATSSSADVEAEADDAERTGEDEEVDQCILTEAERSSRTNVWEGEYREVLNAREALRKVREAEELAKSSRLTKAGKQRKVVEKRDNPKESVRHAVEDALQGTSRKINYEAMGESFREDGSFKSPDEVGTEKRVVMTATVAAPTETQELVSNLLEDDEEEAEAEDDGIEQEEYEFDYYD